MDGILEILAGGGSKTLEIQAGGGVKLEKVFCRGHFDSALSDPENSRNICWRALARQLPILYNSKKKAKSVRCKIEDMRIDCVLCIQAFRDTCERTWKY